MSGAEQPTRGDTDTHDPATVRAELARLDAVRAVLADYFDADTPPITAERAVDQIATAARHHER